MNLVNQSENTPATLENVIALLNERVRGPEPVTERTVLAAVSSLIDGTIAANERATQAERAVVVATLRNS